MRENLMYLCKMQDMYAMLADYGSKMRADDEVVYADLQECVKSFDSALERAAAFTQENHQKHTANMNTDAAAVLEAAQDLSVECMSGQFDDAEAAPAEMRARLAAMEQKVSFVSACLHQSILVNAATNKHCQTCSL